MSKHLLMLMSLMGSEPKLLDMPIEVVRRNRRLTAGVRSAHKCALILARTLTLRREIWMNHEFHEDEEAEDPELRVAVKSYLRLYFLILIRKILFF